MTISHWPESEGVSENSVAFQNPVVTETRQNASVSLIGRAVSSVRGILWLLDAESSRMVNEQLSALKAAILEDAESSYRFSRESAESSNSVCPSCGATWNRIVNVLWKLIKKESTFVWTRPRLVTIVKGIPIYVPENVYEMRDRTNPLNIRHCNDCGNEWEKREPRYVWEYQSVEDYLDYVRYSASALQKGETDSTWLSAYHMERMKKLSGGTLPYRETVALLSKEYRYDKFSVSDKPWLKKFLKSVLDE